MRHARGLAPYAVASLVVVLVTIALVGDAARDALTVGRDLATATPRPSATRALPELSRSGRLAYWRTDPGSNEGQLFVSNVDGTQRRALGKIDNVLRLSLVRWLPDGSAVSYVDAGAKITIAIARVDGTRADLAWTPEMKAAGWVRIIDVHWSPDSRYAATTLMRDDGKTDVWIVAADPVRWSRATTLGDAYAGDWLAPDRLLVHTNGGLVALLGTERPDALRPLTGLSAVSPVLGPDGRVHFVAGRITPGPRDPQINPFPTASAAAVYSVAIDGSDLRKETDSDQDDIRLDAAIGGGRYLIHRGASALQVVLTANTFSVPGIEAGTVNRIVASADGRSLYGFSPTRVVRFESGSTPATAVANPTVVLDSATNADVWLPRTLTLASPAQTARTTKPTARYAFWLSGNVWSMDADGVPALLRPGPTSVRATFRAPPPVPIWSPKGDRLLLVDSDTDDVGRALGTSAAYLLSREGTLRRVPEARAAANSFAWAPDGSSFAVAVDRRGASATAGLPDLEVRFFGADGAQARAPAPASLTGREVAWTSAGIVLLGDDSIDLLAGDARRTIVTRTALAADPRAQPPAGATPTLSSLAASPDGRYLAVRLALTAQTGARVWTVTIRTSDGTALEYLTTGGLPDFAWSPAGLYGTTLPFQRSAATGGITSVAEIRDPASPATAIARQDGRFAGWSPDGSFYYVARSDGLYAYRPGERDTIGIWVSAIGVPVSTTRP